MSVAVTLALPTAAPDGSVITPLMEAVTSWLQAGMERKRRIQIDRIPKPRERVYFDPKLLIENYLLFVIKARFYSRKPVAIKAILDCN
jgi:hypothetical protein